MSINSVNQASYTSTEGVSTYINTSLQPPEVSIFVKYKDYFYNKNILDIGCGAGRTSFYFQHFSEQYIGVDYSESMVDFCRKQYPTLSFRHTDARDLSEFKDESFDFVMFSYNGIDYITDADRSIVFDEIKRVLKKDGLFVFSTHNRNFKNITTKPEFKFSLNPRSFIRNTLDYLEQIKNNNHLKKEQIINNDYAILNDSGNNFTLLTYYISREKQIEQLNKSGFNILEILDMNGQTLKQASDDSHDPWIYFVVQKN